MKKIDKLYNKVKKNFHYFFDEDKKVFEPEIYDLGIVDKKIKNAFTCLYPCISKEYKNIYNKVLNRYEKRYKLNITDKDIINAFNALYKYDKEELNLNNKERKKVHDDMNKFIRGIHDDKKDSKDNKNKNKDKDKDINTLIREEINRKNIKID